MNVAAPYRDFLAFWKRAEHADPAEQERLWGELYADRHPGVMAYYAGMFGEAASLDAALPRFGAVAPSLEERFDALRLASRAEEVAELLRAPAPRRAIAMVGLFTADAWADEFEGEQTAFFALEMTPPGGVLATHELAHVAHALAREDGAWPPVPVLTLIMEGVAATATLRLQPEVPRNVHFNVEDFDAWEAAGDASWAATIDALLACPATEDLAATQRFFWPDWGRAERDVPERVGYLVALRVVDVLLDGHDLAEIVRWPAERALREVRAALEALR